MCDEFPSIVIELNSQSAAYQAALKAGATLVQASLMDFLR
jgi:flagellar hook-associated protein 3 FlgL